MNVSLMADIEDEVVFRCVEDVMHGDGQLDHTKIRAKVASGSGEDRDKLVANLYR